MIRGLCVQRKDVRNPLITLKIRQSSHLIPLHWCLCPVLDPHKHFKKGKNLRLCVQSINVMHIICHFTSLKAHCLTFKSISCVFNRNGENFFACLPNSLATAVQNGFFKDVKEKNICCYLKGITRLINNYTGGHDSNPTHSRSQVGEKSPRLNIIEAQQSHRKTSAWSSDTEELYLT